VRRFFLALWAFTALSNLVFFGAAYEALAWLGAPQPALIALAAAVALVALFRFRLRLITNDRPISGGRRALELGYYTHWCAAIGALLLYVPCATLLLLAELGARIAGAPLPSSLHGVVLVASYGAGLLLAAYGVWIRPRIVRVRRIDIPLSDLDPSLEGYTIAHLSDLHIGSLIAGRRARRWVCLANAEAPDLIALTGDYVTNGVRFHEEIADVLGALRAKDAVIATLGNHDYFGGGEPLISLLRQKGIVLLRNARVTMPRGLEVAGADDTWTRRADVPQAMRGFSGARPLLALAHDPALFPDFARRGAALVLAGHTHWGQVGVPFAAHRYSFATRTFRFSAGLYREGRSTLYVNPGLGTTGPPIRLGSAPEITVFKLRRSEAHILPPK
jgi:uncharacterized protein